MNSKEFLLVLRKVIREEVQSAVQKAMTPLLEQKTPSTYTKTLAPKKSNTEKKVYSENPLLNEILSDTAGFSHNSYTHNDFEEWPTMPMSRMIGTHAPVATPTAISDINGNRVDVNQLASTEAGAAVVKALTKDYSSLMKAIDKKKGM